jgi:hypothetical protein
MYIRYKVSSITNAEFWGLLVYSFRVILSNVSALGVMF